MRQPGSPSCVVLVTGTGTGVGKTWVAARLLATLRRSGITVAARKLAQSYAPADDQQTLDAAVLGRASGEQPEDVCATHRWYPVAMAPPMAAAALGLPPFRLIDLLAELQWTKPGVAKPVAELGLVEAAGGVRSPQAEDGDVVDLALRLRPDRIVVVAEAGLGTINAVRLTLDALRPSLDAPMLAVLNRFDPACDVHRRNRAWLEPRVGVPLAAMPRDSDGSDFEDAVEDIARWVGSPTNR